MSVSSQCPWEIQTKGLKERPWTCEEVHLWEHRCQVLPRMWWRQKWKITRKTWRFATELNPVTVLLGIYRRTWKLTFTLTWTRMFIAALTIMAQTQKLPRCPAVGKWADAADGDNGIVFSTEKGLWSHEKTWRNFTCTLPSEGSQWKGCQLCHLNPSALWKKENYGDSAKISHCQGLGEEGMTRGSQQTTETVPCDIIRQEVLVYVSRPRRPSIHCGPWFVYSWLVHILDELHKYKM